MFPFPRLTPPRTLGSPPHVLHLINSFADGGTERQAIQLANALADSGSWNVTVAVHDGDGPLRELLNPDLRQRVAAFPLIRVLSWYTLTQAQEFRRLLEGAQVDIVHTHGFYPNIFGMAGTKWSEVGVRIASKRESVSLRSPARAALERQALSIATHVVTNCNAVRRELLDARFEDDRVSTIYNAVTPDRMSSHVDLDPMPFDVATSMRIDGPCVAMIANFHHAAKDHATMLRAARRVVDVAPDTQFILAGEGPLRDEVRQLAASLGLERHVHLPGRCRYVPALLERVHVCALSSRSEGFPNAILEYMAAARPVVASDVGGVGEAMVEGTTGYLVPAGDDRAMADRLLRLLGDAPLRRQMGEAGRARVQSEFTMVRQLEATAALYRSELKRSAARRLYSKSH
ncbi:MAG: glycosyltransferase [Gemmatimonadota bacterium]